jgi:hypothetical protein
MRSMKKNETAHTKSTARPDLSETTQVKRFLERHSTTPLSLEVHNGVLRFYKEHEKWLQVNDGVDNFQEWLCRAIQSYTEASIDALYNHDDKQKIVSEYGLEVNQFE